MRDLIKKILKESEENPFKWIEDIEPMRDGWDLYNSEIYGQTFNIKLKDSLRDNECVYEYFPPDLEFDGVTTKVELVSISDNVNLVDERCDNYSGEALLLKFYETNDGHAGDHYEFTPEKNERNYDICSWKCWWVKPQIIEIVP